jgi:hypothetical protein
VRPTTLGANKGYHTRAFIRRLRLKHGLVVLNGEAGTYARSEFEASQVT